MTDKCLSCNAEIVIGGVIEKDGKKVRQKFEMDGKTIHVCKPKPGKQFVPQKPREEFSYEEFDREKNRTFGVRRTGFVGELDPVKTYAEMLMAVAKYRLAESGNPAIHKESEKSK